MSHVHDHIHHSLGLAGADPFAGAASTGLEDDAPDTLEELYYRLEGKRLRLLYLEHSGAPRVVLEGARGSLQELEQRIQVRIRSILVRRNLDERLLLEELTPPVAPDVDGAETLVTWGEADRLDEPALARGVPSVGNREPRDRQGAVIERVVAHRIQQIALTGVAAKLATSA